MWNPTALPGGSIAAGFTIIKCIYHVGGIKSDWGPALHHGPIKDQSRPSRFKLSEIRCSICRERERWSAGLGLRFLSSQLLLIPVPDNCYLFLLGIQFCFPTLPLCYTSRPPPSKSTESGEMHFLRNRQAEPKLTFMSENVTCPSDTSMERCICPIL